MNKIQDILNIGFFKENEVIDIEFRKQAVEFYNSLKEYFSNDWAINNLKKIDKGGYFFDVSAINEKYRGLVILFFPENSKHFPNFSAGTTNSGHKVLIFPTLLNDWDLKYLSTRLIGSKESIIHEFIHYLDQLRYKKKNYKGASKKFVDIGDIENYFNTPAEYNAYYQEGINYWEDLEERLPRDKLDPITKDFKSFYNWMTTKIFRSDYIKRMNPEYKKKFQKRLYDYYISKYQKKE